MSSHRVRISPQQRTLLRALAMWKEERPAGETCLAVALYVALHGRLAWEYPSMTALYRSLDRLEKHGLLLKHRPHRHRATANGSADWRGRPEFSITAKGLAYLEQCEEVPEPAADYVKLIALDAGDGIAFYTAKFALLKTGREFRGGSYR